MSNNVLNLESLFTLLLKYLRRFINSYIMDELRGPTIQIVLNIKEGKFVVFLFIFKSEILL